MAVKPITLYYSCCHYTRNNMELLNKHTQVFRLESPAHDSKLEATKPLVQLLCAPLGYTFGRGSLSQFPALKALLSNTTSVDHIDTGYCAEHGVAVCSLDGEQRFLATITPTAEHTLGLIHALHRRIPSASADVVRENRWDRYHWPAPRMLSQMTLGIIGRGRIGQMVIDRAMPLFQYVCNIDCGDFMHYHFKEEFNKDLSDMLAACDIITFHIDGRPENRNFVDETFLSKMREGSLLINTSRGEVVDHVALLSALRSGRLRGAALDVLPSEHRPMFLDEHKGLLEYARDHDNLILTPHIAGSTQDAWEATQRRVIDMALATLDEADSVETGET